MRTASTGVLPSPVLWKGRVGASAFFLLDEARYVPAFMLALCPLIMVAFTVYGYGVLTIPTGPAAPLKSTICPGIRWRLSCKPRGAFGDILKCIGVKVSPLYSRDAPSTLIPDTFVEVAPRFVFGPASLIAAVSTP